MASLYAAAIALLLLAATDLSIWVCVNTGLSLDYRDAQIPFMRRAFRRRKLVVTAKLLLGAAFIVFFVITDSLGAAHHMQTSVLTMGVCLLFVAASGWDSLTAFRDYAARNLPQPDRGGYRGR